MTCDAKIRPFPGDEEVACELEEGHDVNHRGDVLDRAYPGSRTAIVWEERDRRNYHGAWPGSCDAGTCSLPLGHGGNHAP